MSSSALHVKIHTCGLTVYILQNVNLLYVAENYKTTKHLAERSPQINCVQGAYWSLCSIVRFTVSFVRVWKTQATLKSLTYMTSDWQHCQSLQTLQMKSAGILAISCMNPPLKEQ